MRAKTITPRLPRGSHRCQCSNCRERFNSVKAFDLHRRGTPGVDRRCLSPDDMRAAGMSQIEGGWWISRADPRRHVPRAPSTPDLARPLPTLGVPIAQE